MFEADSWNGLWIIAIIVFVLIEAVTAQLVSIWFIVGSVAALAASFFGVPFYLQLIIFVVVSAVALAATRPIIRKYIKPRKERTNADRVIGQVGVVTEKIDNIGATGQVKVDGKEWTARSENDEPVEEGKQVVIKRIDGVKLIVAEK